VHRWENTINGPTNVNGGEGHSQTSVKFGEQPEATRCESFEALRPTRTSTAIKGGNKRRGGRKGNTDQTPKRWGADEITSDHDGEVDRWTDIIGGGRKEGRTSACRGA